MSKKMTDILAGIACLVVALAFYVQGIDLSLEANRYPKVLEIFIAIMGIYILIRGLVSKNSSKTEEEDFDKIKGIVTVIASILYLIGIKYIGFYVSTFVFLTLVSWYLSKKGINLKAFGVSASFGLILTVILYILFKMILLVPTPNALLI